MHADMLFIGGSSFVLVPKLGRLVAVVPFEVFVARAEDTFFRPDAVLVASDGQVERPPAVFADGELEGVGFKLGAAFELAGFGADAMGEGFFVAGDDEVQAPFFDVFFAEFVDFLEFVAGVDVDDWEGDAAEEGLAAEPEEGCGIFADGPEHRDVAELAVGLADNVDALILEFVQPRHLGRHHKLLEAAKYILNISQMPVFFQKCVF